jgi:hypothetical protein
MSVIPTTPVVDLKMFSDVPEFLPEQLQQIPQSMTDTVASILHNNNPGVQDGEQFRSALTRDQVQSALTMAGCLYRPCSAGSPVEFWKGTLPTSGGFYYVFRFLFYERHFVVCASNRQIYVDHRLSDVDVVSIKPTMFLSSDGNIVVSSEPTDECLFKFQ